MEISSASKYVLFEDDFSSENEWGKPFYKIL